MTHMTRAAAKVISAQAMAALKAVAEEHGFSVSNKGGTLDHAGGALFKIQFSPLDEETGEVRTPEFDCLERIKPGFAGKTFYLVGTGYVTLTGYNTRAKRYPVQYTHGGKRYKAPRSFLDRCTEENMSE